MNPTKASPFFFLVVDDGGFEQIMPDAKGPRIPFSAYRNLLTLAETFDIQIVLACTTAFLDIHRATPKATPHQDSKALVALLEQHNDRLLVADHGYSHLFQGRYTEFFDPQLGSRDEQEQRQHIEYSLQVYESLGWAPPTLAVPPAHGWEPGVTDRLYAEHGFTHLSSMLWLKRHFNGLRDIFSHNPLRLFQPRHQYPNSSEHLQILPRIGLNIPAGTTLESSLQLWRTRASVLPTPTLISWLIHRRLPDQPHNYIAHVANFVSDDALQGFITLFEELQKKGVYLAKSFDESLQLFSASQKS